MKKMDLSKFLNIAVVALGVAGTLLSSKVESDNRKKMKDELRDEILKEINNNKGTL